MAIFDQTCENSCERVAFQIEIRRLKKSVEDWHGMAVRAERLEEKLRAENEALRNAIYQARGVFECEPATKDVLDYVEEVAKAALRGERGE